MKKIFIIISLLFLSIGLASSSKAQNVSREQFSQVFAEYMRKYDEYVISHEKYILSKKQYESFNTLSSKENVQRDTKDMLYKREEVLIYYLKSLISKLDDSSLSIPQEDKDSYISQFNSEIDWLNEHRITYKVTDSPEILSEKSEAVDTRFKVLTPVIYKCLYHISKGKVVRYDERYDLLYNDLITLTEKIKVEQRDAYKLSESKTEIIDRWFGEIGVKDEEYQKFLDEGDKNLLKISERTAYSTYKASIKVLTDAKNVMLKKISYMKEIVKEIKISEY